MSSLTRQFLSAACVALMAIALSSIAFAQVQTGSPSVPKDVFSPLRENLNEAADRALAKTLANRPWMRADPSVVRSTAPSVIQETRIVKLSAAIHRVNQLRPTLESILRDEGVPVQLSAVVLVESGGLATALSPKGARGIWQFMPDTAKRYGLVVDEVRDDRTDVVKSTRAAARYLRDLHATFGDWSLALAAYNAGQVAVTNATNQAQSKDFGLLDAGGLLPLETRNYVPAVMDAINHLQYSGLSDLRGHRNEPTRIVYALSGSEE